MEKYQFIEWQEQNVRAIPIRVLWYNFTIPRPILRLSKPFFFISRLGRRLLTSKFSSKWNFLELREIFTSLASLCFCAWLSENCSVSFFSMLKSRFMSRSLSVGVVKIFWLFRETCHPMTPQILAWKRKTRIIQKKILSSRNFCKLGTISGRQIWTVYLRKTSASIWWWKLQSKEGTKTQIM